MVLSKFCTLTVVRATSITSPSAPNFGISIQSPRATIRLAVSCTPATSPRMASLKISIITAVRAPSPLKISTGDFPMTEDTTKIAPAAKIKILTIWRKPLMGISRETGKRR